MIRIPKKRIADALIWLLAVALLLWLGDWTVWRVRVSRGGGYDTVQVNQILLIPLKNHKMEADAQKHSRPALRALHLPPRRRRPMLVATPPRHRVAAGILSVEPIPHWSGDKEGR